MNKENNHQHDLDKKDAKSEKAAEATKASAVSLSNKESSSSGTDKASSHKAESTASVAELAELAHKIENQKAELKKAKARKRRRTIIAVVAAIAVVIVLLIVLVVTTIKNKNSGGSSSGNNQKKSQTDLLVEKENDKQQKADKQRSAMKETIEELKNNIKNAKTDDDKVQAYSQLVYSYTSNGDNKDAEETVKEVIEKFPNNDESYAIAGQFYSGDGGNNQISKAIDYYQKALDIVQNEEQTTDTQSAASNYQDEINSLKNRQQ